MGAPAGHPFFGNQYTDGGYVQGSYAYFAETVKKVARPVGQAAAPLAKPTAGAPVPNPVPSLKGLRMPPISTASLAAVGAVVLIGGVATYAYLRSKSAGASGPALEDRADASFGVCGACGEPLAGSGPAELQQDENGGYVICHSCSHPNRASYGEEDEQHQPDLGSD